MVEDISDMNVRYACAPYIIKPSHFNISIILDRSYLLLLNYILQIRVLSLKYKIFYYYFYKLVIKNGEIFVGSGMCSYRLSFFACLFSSFSIARNLRFLCDNFY